jgi:hypothetical protein
MENRLTRVREILNNLVDANGGDPYHSGKGRFWNLSRDVFVNGPIAGRRPIEVGRPADSFLVKILKADTDGLARMPIGGPSYIADADLAFIEQWILDGAPDIDVAIKSAGRMSLQALAEDLRKIPFGACEDSLACLKESLRESIRIEFSTIPPYLTAWWSIITEDGGDPDGAEPVLKCIVVEEMLHMGLVSNMLAAISSPAEVFDYRVEAPVYPSKPPGGVRPHLTVALRKLNKAQFGVFTELESFQDLAAGIDTIGEFYDALSAAFRHMNPTLSVSRQVERKLFGREWLTKLTSIPEVLNAIDLIRRQGEGRVSSGEPWEDPSDHTKGMGHYFQFGEFYKGLSYVEVSGTWDFQGSSVTLPKLHPMADIPTAGYDPNLVDPAAKPALQEFKLQYGKMLDAMTQAWSGVGGPIGAAIAAMRALAIPAKQLMTINVGRSSETYGPDFRV